MSNAPELTLDQLLDKQRDGLMVNNWSWLHRLEEATAAMRKLLGQEKVISDINLAFQIAACLSTTMFLLETSVAQTTEAVEAKT